MAASLGSAPRPSDIASWYVSVSRRADGSVIIEPLVTLGDYPARLTDALDEWAQRAPERTFLAQRRGSLWRRISYAEFRKCARAVARSLLYLGVAPDRPVAILSGNDIEHAILGVGAMYAGIPYAPISPAYSLVSSDLGRLRHIFDRLMPGLVFAADGSMFARALETVVPPDTALAVTENPAPGRRSFRFADFARYSEGVEDGLPSTSGPDTVAKILFTSGSTGIPKGVITTHRMLASNQQMLRQAFPLFAEEPLVVCDWLPWSHTFGGSHNFGLVLYNGGTMYIDEGRPVAGAWETTVQNLRDVAPTLFFNVPKAYEMLVEALRSDPALRTRFFSRLRMMFYAAAGLSQYVWDELQRLAVETCGGHIPMLTGLGATETAPFATCTTASNTRAGVVGLPAPGVRLKLAPVEDKLEARVQGPNVTPGYWREPELTRAAFDDEGYYRLGDALRFVDDEDPARGLLFDGRIAEDFKLATGTWVSVGPLRTRFLLYCAPYVRDVVIAGHDRDEVTALIFADGGNADRALFQRLLRTFAEQSSGSSTRIERAILLDEAPSLDAGELTEKGTVNQKVALRRRAAVVERLYSRPFAAEVIHARASGDERPDPDAAISDGMENVCPPANL